MSNILNITVKVLAFLGSPRRGGNTELLLDSVLNGAQSEGVDVEKIYVHSKNLQLGIILHIFQIKNLHGRT
ncbi:MAG: flavodoxin family protein [Methanosarcinales archaeon]